MNLLKKYPILTNLLSPFRRSQQKTVISIIAAICEVAQANSLAIASALSGQSEIQLGSALTKFYRFLRNERFDNWLLTEQLIGLFAERKKVVLCLDWTKWQDKFSLLVASICVEKRSLPIAVSAVVKSKLARSQNLWEETFMRLCVERLKRVGVKAIWLCDRGFHRVAWLKCLLDLGQEFVVRLQKDVFAEVGKEQKLLSEIKLKKGEFIDLGFVYLRIDRKVKVRVIGIWAKESKEIWWLATNLRLPLAEIAKLYDRRMAIEEQFRDAKGVRFGLKMKWTCFTKTEYVERMYLLMAIAMLMWTSVGKAVVEEKPKVRLKCKHKGNRLSLLRVGIYHWRKFTKTIKLTTKFVKNHLPKPKGRNFHWLIVNQN